MYIMDFGDIKSESLSSNFFNVARIRESGVSQDEQCRSRKSPRKRFKVARTSASLVLNQLKNIFWYPSDFMSRIRTRRNWRPEFFTRCLRYNRCGCNKSWNAALQYNKRNFVPEAPKIYSIGLRSGARNLSDSDDLSRSCGAIRNFKKRFARRPMIICKYSVAQSTPTSSLSTDVSLKAYTNCQTMIIDCTKSTEIIPKYNLAQSNHNSHHSQLHEHAEEKESDTLDSLHDRAANNRASVSGNFKDPSVRKAREYDSSCVTRDAQIQTSNRRGRQRKMKRKSKPVPENVSRSKELYEKEPRIVVDFRTARSRSSSGRNHRDERRLSVLENKRAKYINKFTAVNRQIEEITATLQETCCDGENTRNNLVNCDEYFSSISDDARANAINWSGVESRTIAGRRNTSREKNSLANVKKIIEESRRSDQCKNMREIWHVDNLNNETVSSPKETIALSRNLEKIPNDVFGHDSAIKETVYSSNRISRHRTRAKYHLVKQISFDLAKNQELQESSIENKSFDKVRLKNNISILNNDKRARDLAERPINLEASRYCKIIEEKIGEVAILENIKKRIDRDFDDPPAERSENDTEDFFTVSQKSSKLDHHGIIDARTIEESESTPLIVSTYPDSTETEIHNSMSIGAMSEYSSQTSALSKYFSCTRLPSLISLTKNEDERLAVDRSTIAHDSCSALPSNYHYYDSRSNLSPNNRSFTNLSPSLDRSSLEYVLIGTANEPYDTFGVFEGRENVAEGKIREWEYPFFGERKRNGDGWVADKRYTADSTLETSKSSRYVGSMDSGVFSSSMIDLYPAESSFDVVRMELKKKRHAGKLDGSSAAVDSSSDSSYTDDTLDRKVNNVIKDLTKNLILCERKARRKLKARDASHSQRVVSSRACKLSRSLYDTCRDFLSSPRRSSEDERIVSISTPSLLSLSDSEIEDCESRRQRAFC